MVDSEKDSTWRGYFCLRRRRLWSVNCTLYIPLFSFFVLYICTLCCVCVRLSTSTGGRGDEPRHRRCVSLDEICRLVDLLGCPRRISRFHRLLFLYVTVGDGTSLSSRTASICVALVPRMCTRARQIKKQVTPRSVAMFSRPIPFLSRVHVQYPPRRGGGVCFSPDLVDWGFLYIPQHAF